MESDAQPVPGTARPGGRTARTRERVLTAVAAILREHGYDAVTVDAVAERSGVHRTTVYRRWRDPGGLLADTLDAAREQPWEPPDTGTLLGDLTEINHQVVAALADPASITQALIAASFRSPAAARALRSFWADRYARAAVVVERAVARGEATARVDARTVVVAACAPVFHELALMRGPAVPGLAESSARIAAAAVAPGPSVED
ncbi:TetR/AcrR family transcriptional regulator [Actinoplanes teichomyceticus]|uniref:TetR/AcrR family transcriptional regulator n=1 Tax=Actinoplanes teichomyceticus TaxID=1867 RepID=UPI001A6432F9|nr:TetR/AcrR family transcriptional regulator [Actinoplanes teichomyceticus]GIF17026.1 TetR family transcriptional regulator [Actinoplanes teichomyceticus]